MRAVRNALSTLALGGLVALGALMLLPPLLGFERYVVTGGSMGGSIARGSVVLDELVSTRSLRVGDVITYRPPAHRARVTHRIVWVGRDRGGAPAFRTKGDRNAAADPWRFTLRGARQARVVASVPYAGYAIAALELRPVRVVALGGPALLIAVASLRRRR